MHHEWRGEKLPVFQNISDDGITDKGLWNCTSIIDDRKLGRHKVGVVFNGMIFTANLTEVFQYFQKFLGGGVYEYVFPNNLISHVRNQYVKRSN
jgi:hypothetical protein